jgi:hypothetical protein
MSSDSERSTLPQVAASNTVPTTPSDEQRRTVERKATIMRVWQRMGAKYIGLWQSPMGESAFTETGELTVPAAEWLHGLRGLTRRQINDAIDRLDTLGVKFPPNLVEFRAMCWNFETFESVVDYLHGRAPLTPFKRAVANKLDIWRWRKKSEAESLKDLRKAYDTVCAEIQNGRTLSPLDEALAHQKKEHKAASPQVVEHFRAKIREALNMTEAEEKAPLEDVRP